VEGTRNTKRPSSGEKFGEVLCSKGYLQLIVSMENLTKTKRRMTMDS
jgi:hypothetical protein